jgi:hypothetical protein
MGSDDGWSCLQGPRFGPRKAARPQTTAARVKRLISAVDRLVPRPGCDERAGHLYTCKDVA